MKRSLILFLAAALMMSVLGGCSKTEESVSVQSVSMIMGLGNVGGSNRYSGLVTSGKTETFELDESMTLKEILVEEDQFVKAGDLLYTYDNATLLLTLEQQRLEIEGMKNSVITTQEEIEELEKTRERVSESNKLAYTLQIQSLQATLRETEYNIAVKEKELELKEQESEKTEVYTTVTGRVTSINKEGGYDNYGNKLPFMTVIETGNLRVKGVINEMNIQSLYEGCPVIIRSRTSDEVWTGSISMIDWNNQISNNNNYYYSDEMSSSSKYPFYVALDSEEGLFIGEHVYIEAGTLSDEQPAVFLPSYFVVTEGDSTFVWAKDGSGKLEKRTVVLGAYDEFMDQYTIESGLGLEDYIAFPEENLKVGMPTLEWDESMFGGSGMMDGEFMGEFEGGFEGEFDGYYEGDFEGEFEVMPEEYIEEEITE